MKAEDCYCIECPYIGECDADSVFNCDIDADLRSYDADLCDFCEHNGHCDVALNPDEYPS